MVSGPYMGHSSDPEVHKANLLRMNQEALSVFLKGHIPVIGVNLALPVIACSGTDSYNDLMMPISLGIADRCDAVLRIGGPSNGADEEVELFVRKGLPVYKSLQEIPSV